MLTLSLDDPDFSERRASGHERGERGEREKTDIGSKRFGRQSEQEERLLVE